MTDTKVPTRCPGCGSRGWMQRNNVNQCREDPNGESCRNVWHTDARLAGHPCYGPEEVARD